MAGVLTRNIPQTDIGTYSGSISVLLLVPVIAMAVYFKKAVRGKGE
jgi:hypothetical protein